MKVLVIPDVHLKPWMFQRASELLREGRAERAVCLMDIADDWQQQFNLDLYAQTYGAAIAFAKDHPDTLWCYGNHDLCYQWNQRETGYSKVAPWLVCEKLRILRETLPDEGQLAYLHRVDNVLFSHGGLFLCRGFRSGFSGRLCGGLCGSSRFLRGLCSRRSGAGCLSAGSRGRTSATAGHQA